MADYLENVPLIVTNAAKDDAAKVFSILDPASEEGGLATFSVALSANGQLPATHWGAYSRLEEPTFNALKGSNQEFKTYLDNLAAKRGRTKMGPIVAFKQALSVGNPSEDFHTFAARLNLKMVQEAV